MHEAERNKKLALMGVAQWYSRFQLPGAAASSDALFTQPPVADISPSPAVQNDKSPDAALIPDRPPVNKPKLDLVESILSSTAAPSSAKGLAEKEAASKKDAIEKETPQEVQQENQAIRGISEAEITASSAPISLRAYSWGDFIALSEPDGNFPPDIELSLFSNIMFALYGINEKAMIKGEYSWPVFSNSKLPCNRNATGDNLAKSWLADLQQSGPTVILFGQLPPSLSASDAAKEIQVDYSLADLLIDPTKKTLLWRTLKSQAPSLTSGH